MIQFRPSRYTHFLALLVLTKWTQRQWRTEGFWRPGRRWKLAPLTPTCRTGKRRRRSPMLLGGGSGAEPQPPTLFGVFGCEWNPFFWIAFNTIFNSTCQTNKCRKRFPLLLGKGGLGRSPSRQRYWEHLGVNGTHFLIALTPFSTLRVRLASSGRRSPSLLGVWAEPQQPTPLGELRVNGTHFSIALTTFWTLLAPTAGMQPAARIVRVSFGNSRRGAAVNFTGACRQAHIWGLWHVHQNARLYVLLLHRGAEMWMGHQNGTKKIHDIYGAMREKILCLAAICAAGWFSCMVVPEPIV